MAPVSEQPEPQGAGGDPDTATTATPAPGPPEVQEPRRENGGERCPGSGGSGARPRAAEEAPGSPEAPEPPEGGWGWVVMLAAMWCNGAVFGIQNSCGVLFVSMLRLFGSSDDKQLVFKTGEGRGRGLGAAPAGGVPAPGPQGPDPPGGPGRSPGALGNIPRGDPAGWALPALPPGRPPPGYRGEAAGQELVCSPFFHSWIFRHPLSCIMAYSARFWPQKPYFLAPLSLKVTLND